MKEILIIFIILLVLLILLSTLGGSIRVKENYDDDDIPLYNESLIPEKSRPWAYNPQFVEEEEKEKPVKKVTEEEVQEMFQGGVVRMDDDVSPYEYDDSDFASV